MHLFLDLNIFGLSDALIKFWSNSLKTPNVFFPRTRISLCWHFRWPLLSTGCGFAAPPCPYYLKPHNCINFNHYWTCYHFYALTLHESVIIKRHAGDKSSCQELQARGVPGSQLNPAPHPAARSIRRLNQYHSEGGLPWSSPSLQRIIIRLGIPKSWLSCDLLWRRFVNHSELLLLCFEDFDIDGRTDYFGSTQSASIKHAPKNASSKFS
jgi:hypothetical protein